MEDSSKIVAQSSELFCDSCGGGHSEDKLVRCGGCGKCFHLFCLTPPLVELPVGEWICAECEQGEEDEGCEEQEYSLEDFASRAADFKRSWFGGEAKSKKVVLYIQYR